jgi:DNA-binding MarR family transcriptional regulator
LAGPLATDLSRSWRELGSLLASRRLLASLGNESGARLTPTKLRALELLAETGDMRVRALAERMCVEETTATRLVDRLEAAGMVARRPVEADRRGTAVALTREGESLAEEMLDRRHEFFRDVLAALDPDERAELVRLSRKAVRALRARTEEPVAR